MSSVCDTVPEKNKAYSINITNSTNENITTLIIGTTPNSVGQTFLESFTIPGDYGDKQFNVSLIVDTNHKAYDNATVTDAGTNDLVFTDEVVAGKWLGLTTSVKSTVKDENGKLLSGGNCKISIWSNDATQMLHSSTNQLFRGELKTNFNLEYDRFEEATDYKIKLICYCGANTSATACIDEDGVNVENSVGIATTAFTTNTWITINEDPMPIVYENGIDYPDSIVFAGFGERVFYKVNITNNADTTLELDIATFLTNADTGAVFSGEGANAEVSVNIGNSTLIGRHIISEKVPTGVYYVTKFFDVLYNNIIVSQGIITTENFNITGTDDSFILENVITDKYNYYTGEKAHVCVNLTNNFYKRIEFEVLYNLRCGVNNLDSDTDRSLVAEHTELRALSAGTTQNQCAELNINYLDHLKYKTTQCYASVTVMSPYINTFDNKKSITSPNFNITDFGMYPEYELNPTYPIVKLFPDWRRFDNLIDNVGKSYFRTKINISKIREEYLDPNDKILDDDWDVYAICTENMPLSTEHYNYTVLDSSGNVIDNEIEAKALQWKPNGESISRCAIGIENVNFSDPGDDYFEVIIWFEDFEERQTNALEGINNSAGTFDFSINAPNVGAGVLIDITGIGITGQGQVMNRDVEITCQVLNYPSTITTFQTFATDRFSFTHRMNIPEEDGTYTVSCKGIDSKFGTFITGAVTDNYQKTNPGGVSVSSSSGTININDNNITILTEELPIKTTLKNKIYEIFVKAKDKKNVILPIFLLISVCSFFAYKKKMSKQKDENNNEVNNDLY